MKSVLRLERVGKNELRIKNYLARLLVKNPNPHFVKKMLRRRTSFELAWGIHKLTLKKMKIAFLPLAFLASIIAFSQQSANEQMIIDAQAEYQNGNYEAAASKYLEILKSLEVSDASESTMVHRYNAACFFTLANQTDLAFEQLQILSAIGYTNLEQLQSDTDLTILRTDSRWPPIAEAISANFEKIRPLSKEELKRVFDAFLEAKKKVFREGSTVADVDNMFGFYTDDYKYNHPRYGGTYSRSLLYSNTVKFLKKGAYRNYPAEEVTNIILGENAVAIEFKTATSEDTRMTLFKFRKDKIFYVEEFW